MTQHTQFKLSKQVKKNMTKNQAIDLLEHTAQLLAAMVQANLINAKCLADVSEREMITPDFEDKKEAYMNASENLSNLMHVSAEHISDMFGLTDQGQEVANQTKS